MRRRRRSPSNPRALTPEHAEAAALNAVYGMRMSRVNITVPDELVASARREGINISAVTASALAREIADRAKRRALDVYLEELEVELGPVPDHEMVQARRWAEALMPASATTVRSA